MVLEQLSRIERGWTVKGSDGSSVGDVVAVRKDHLVVQAGTITKHDLYVPVTAVESIGDESVVLNVPASDADEAGWRYPPQRSYTRRQDLPPTESTKDQTTMTGAAFGAGAGVSSAGPPEPGFGDAVQDRLGGSGRAGLSGLSERPEAEVKPVDEAGTAEGAAEGETSAGDSVDDDTSDDTSEDTSGDEAGEAGGGESVRDVPSR